MGWTGWCVVLVVAWVVAWLAGWRIRLWWSRA